MCHFLLFGRVCNSCFLTSRILDLRDATWYLLLKLNLDSENPNFYGSVSWFLISRSHLVLGNVFGPKGVSVPLTSASSEGLTDFCHLGKRMSKWNLSRSIGLARRCRRGKKAKRSEKRSLGTDFFLLWLCYVFTTGLEIWTCLPPGSEFTVFMVQASHIPFFSLSFYCFFVWI